MEGQGIQLNLLSHGRSSADLVHVQDVALVLEEHLIGVEGGDVAAHGVHDLLAGRL